VSSTGITQKPLAQTVPEQWGPHWASDAQGVRQMASTHDQAAGHWALDVHWGTGRPSGRQRPRSQVSAAFRQSVARWQAAWQKPLMQAPPGPHCDE
jgi:hypothetical protein